MADERFQSLFVYLTSYQYESDKALNIQSFVYLRSNQEAI